jgi:sensor histidine kinase regulating citrate/malate metabolism
LRRGDRGGKGRNLRQIAGWIEVHKPDAPSRRFFFATKGHGMGMGLAVSRWIIEAHGGRLWATVNELRGAIFQFSLPTSRERAVTQAAL